MKLRTAQPKVRMIGRQTVIPEQPRGANARGYTYKWQQYRIRWLEAHPICGDRLNGPSPEHSECVRQGRTTAATDVDHIERITGPNDERFWKPHMHQSLCHSCHSIKTQREQGAGWVESSMASRA